MELSKNDFIKTPPFMGLMLSLIILLTLQWAVLTYAIGQFTDGQLSGRLQREGESLLTSAKFNEAGKLQIDFKRVSNVYQRPFSGHYYVIFSDQHCLVSRSLWDADIDIKALQPGKRTKE